MASSDVQKLFTTASPSVILVEDYQFGNLWHRHPTLTITPLIKDGRPRIELRAKQYSAQPGTKPLIRWTELPLNKCSIMFANHGKVWDEDGEFNSELEFWKDYKVSFERNEVINLETGKSEKPELVFLELNFSRIWNWDLIDEDWRGASFKKFESRRTRDFLTKMQNFNGMANILVVVEAYKDRGYLEEFVRLCNESRGRHGYVVDGGSWGLEEQVKYHDDDEPSPIKGYWDDLPGPREWRQEYEKECKSMWEKLQPTLYPQESEEVTAEHAHVGLKVGVKHYEEKLAAMRKTLKKLDGLKSLSKPSPI